MATVISVTSNKTGTKVEMETSKDFGTDLASMGKLLGEEVAYSMALGQLVVRGAAIGRGVLDKGGTVEAAQAAVAAWVPGVKRQRVALPPAKQAEAAWANMSPEEQKAFLKTIKNS